MSYTSFGRIAAHAASKALSICFLFILPVITISMAFAGSGVV
jgi:hypothetical protein